MEKNKMKKTISLLSVLSAILLSSTASFAATNWDVIEKSSHLNFVATQSGKDLKGEFTKFEPTITFDKEDLANSAIKVVVNTGSAITKDKMSNDSLLGKDWLNTENFPEAVFESTEITAATSDKSEFENYVATGTLTLLGVSKDVTLPFTLTKNGENTRAFGGLSLKRLDFGVGESSDPNGTMIANDITVEFDILAKPSPKKE